MLPHMQPFNFKFEPYDCYPVYTAATNVHPRQMKQDIIHMSAFCNLFKFLIACIAHIPM